jgi:hypothetical protein
MMSLRKGGEEALIDFYYVCGINEVSKRLDGSEGKMVGGIGEEGPTAGADR